MFCLMVTHADVDTLLVDPKCKRGYNIRRIGQVVQFILRFIQRRARMISCIPGRHQVDKCYRMTPKLLGFNQPRRLPTRVGMPTQEKAGFSVLSKNISHRIRVDWCKEVVQRTKITMAFGIPLQHSIIERTMQEDNRWSVGVGLQRSIPKVQRLIRDKHSLGIVQSMWVWMVKHNTGHCPFGPAIAQWLLPDRGVCFSHMYWQLT